jgi:hypothetical protein
MPRKKARAVFIEPMRFLSTEKLPEGPEWLNELKLDGYRASAIESGGKVQLRIAGPSDRSIMSQTRHRSVQMVRRYIRDGSLFRDNSAGKLGCRERSN